MKLKKELAKDISDYDDDTASDILPLDDDDFSFSLDKEPTDEDLRDVDEEERIYRRRRKNNLDDDYNGFGYSRDDDDGFGDYNEEDYLDN